VLASLGSVLDRDWVVHGMVQRIMEDPIKQGEGLLRGVGPAQLNGSGRRFCSAFAELTDKYPFKTESKTDATLDDLNTVFRPVEGKFDQFYESALKNYHVHRSRGRHQGLHLARSIASGKACRQLGRLRFRIHQL
jgi:type VI protein secretion system component VasK